MVESESVVLLDDRLPGEATSKYYIILISDSFHDHDLLNVLYDLKLVTEAIKSLGKRC